MSSSFLTGRSSYAKMKANQLKGRKLMSRTREFDKDVALQQALQVFWQVGYEKASVQSLLDAMGINRKSMYDTFGDKHALYLAALQRYLAQVNEAIDAIVARPVPAPEKIRALLALIMKNQDRYTGCLIVNMTVELAPSDPATRQLLQAEYERLTTTFTTFLKEGQAAGTLRKDLDSAAQAQLLVNTWIGVRANLRLTADLAAFHQVIATTVAGLRADEA